MGRIGATRPHFGGGGTWGQLLEQGGVRAADGSNWGGGWVGAERRALSSWTGVRGISSGNREGYAQRMGRIGVADGSEQDNEWGRLGRRMGRSGATRPHFGGGSTFIRRVSYVWSGAAGGKQAASGGMYAANRYSVVD